MLKNICLTLLLALPGTAAAYDRSELAELNDLYKNGRYEEALEGYKGHGLFTYVLAEGLNGKADKGKSGFVKTTELADYVDNEVPILAERVFKRAQYPTISISGMGFPIGQIK